MRSVTCLFCCGKGWVVGLRGWKLKLVPVVCRSCNGAGRQEVRP